MCPTRQRLRTLFSMHVGLMIVLPLLVVACDSPQQTPTIPATGTTTQSIPARVSPVISATTNGTPSPIPATSSSLDLPTPNSQARRGGTITAGSKGDFSSLDPQICYDNSCLSVITAVFNGLLTYAPQSTNLIPNLAEQMPDISIDKKTYIFHLKKGIPFSDGTEVTSADVRYSIERNLTPELQALGGPFGGFLLSIEGAQEYADSQTKDKQITQVSGIQTPDTYTISFRLKQPDQSFLYALALVGNVVPKTIVEKAWSPDRKTNSFFDNPIGTGPYKVASYEKGKTLTLVRNPTYAADKLGSIGYVDRIVYQLNVDETTQIQRIKAGQMDYAMDGVPAAEYLSLINEPQYTDQIIKTPVVNNDFIFMNIQMTPFDNSSVRRAFEYIFNTSKMNQLLNNRGITARGIFPPNMPGYNPNLETGYRFDPTQAKALLQAANFDFNQPITFWGTTIDDDQKIAQQAAADLKAAGLTDVRTKSEPVGVYVKDIGKPKTVQMGLFEWFQDFPDPSDFIIPILSCATAVEGGANPAFYCNPAVDAEELQARGEPDRTKRLLMYQDVEKKIMADAPLVPWRHRVNVDFISKTLGGYYYHPALYIVFTQYWKTS